MAYQSDVGEALWKLRRQVAVEAGLVDRRWEGEEVEPAVGPTYDDVRAALAEYVDVAAEELGDFGDSFAEFMGERPAPRDRLDQMIEAALQSAVEGTGSILDVYRVTETPEHGTVTPLDTNDVAQILGTARPTWSDVCDRLAELQEHVLVQTPWAGIVMTIYDDNDTPAELLFAGVSGDS